MSKVSLTVLAGLFLLLSVATAAIWWINAGEPINNNDDQSYNFVVPRGQSATEIANRLKTSGLIRSAACFKLIVRLDPSLHGGLQAGNYNLKKSQTPFQIAHILTNGMTDRRVTIIEGLRQEEIYQKLTSSDFDLNYTDWSSEITNRQLEGQLFPDTYQIPDGANSAEIIDILTANFDQKVLPLYQNEAVQGGLSLRQVITIASLVEREAKDPTDRSIVAGIILKRFNAGWALQIDATVQYAVSTRQCQPIKGGLPVCDWWPKHLSSEDLMIGSPYNTYRQNGLPPLPIDNPGLGSITAVLNPVDTNYWFYLTDNNGQTHYAATNEEHNLNIRKYLY